MWHIMPAPVLQSFAIYLNRRQAAQRLEVELLPHGGHHLAILGSAAGRTVGLDQVLRPRVTGPSVLAGLYRLAS